MTYKEIKTMVGSIGYPTAYYQFPEYKFTMFAGDYNRETELIYDGEPYAIYRSYHGQNDTVELYAERKGGTNGGV